MVKKPHPSSIKNIKALKNEELIKKRIMLDQKKNYGIVDKLRWKD